MRRRRGRRGARWARGSTRLYRALLWLYPPSLRRAYGDDMLRLFNDSLRDDIASAGPPGALRAWARTLADLAISLPREWPHELALLRPRHPEPHQEAPQSASGGRQSGMTLFDHFAVRYQMREDKFEKFTERARKVLSLSQEEAQRFGHNYIGTEHLLLGLLRESDGIAAKVLLNLGVELEKARNAVEFIIGRGDRVVLGEIGLTPRAKKVIELAVDEAHRLNHHYIGTEHILLGLVREGEGIAAGVLQSLGVNLERVRFATIQVLNSRGSATMRASPTGTPPPHAPRPDLGRFTSGARGITAQAISEARERDQREVGTGHVLLALLEERAGAAAATLSQAGINLDTLRQTLERELGPRGEGREQPAKGPVSLDTHTLRMIALAADEASAMNHRFVGSEHLLLGMLREGEGLGAQVLLEQAADLEALRELSLRQMTRVSAIFDKRPALGGLTLFCRDAEVTARYYLRHFAATPLTPLSWPAAEASEQLWEVRLPGGGPLLSLRAASDDAQRAGAASIELAIWVGDVDLMWRTLKDAEVPALSAVSEGPHGRSFSVTDPDGRLLRIYAQDTQPDA